MQFNRIGIENTVDMNRPLLSKYCSREKDLQFLAASSFMVSEQYTNNTEAVNAVQSIRWASRHSKGEKNIKFRRIRMKGDRSVNVITIEASHTVQIHLRKTKNKIS